MVKRSILTEANVAQMANLHLCEEFFIHDLIDEGATFETAQKLLLKHRLEVGKPVKHKRTWGGERGPLAGKSYVKYEWPESKKEVKEPEPEPEPEPEKKPDKDPEKGSGK